MHLRLRAARKQLIGTGVTIACLCVISLVYSDAIQQRLRVKPANTRLDIPSLVEISKPFSFTFQNAELQTPRLVNVAVENLLGPDPVPTDSQVPDEGYPQTSGAERAESPWIGAIGPAGSTRPSMLFFRSSLPTFGQTRSANSYRRALGAAQYLDTSFNSLFDSVFAHGDDPALPADLSRQRPESRNPFTDARQKADAEAAPPASTPSAPPTPPPDKGTPAQSDQSSASTPATTPAPQAPAGGGAGNPPAPEPPFLVVGDFSGSGTIEARSATRVDDSTFAFQDAQRVFSLYVNPAAVELQRSFGVDDVNRDGIADLLVTSRAAMVGAVLLGDGQGNYGLAGTFPTGYEPIVPLLGPMGDGYRDIIAVDVRSGWVQTFRHHDAYRLLHGQAAIDFSPDFVGLVTESDSNTDFLMAAQAGKAASVYQWLSDGTLALSDQSLPPAPSFSIQEDFLQENAPSNVQIYQVGSRISVMLTDSNGASFNVASFKTFPGIYVMIGDILKHRTLDVAVAYLLSATPGH